MASLCPIRPHFRRSTLWGRVGLAAAALSLAVAYWPSVASAAEYEVEVCTQSSTLGDGIVTATEGDPRPIFFDPCGIVLFNGIRQGKPAGTVASMAASSWTLVAPENTRFLTLNLEQSFFSSARSFLDWFLFSGTGAQLFHVRDDRPLPPLSQQSYKPNARTVTGVLVCLEGVETNCPGGEFTISLRNIVAVLEDISEPVLFGPGLPATTVRGVTPIFYNASDAGSGIASATLIVDGTELPSVPDLNGGRCQRPYKFLLPCRLNVSASLPLDTTSLSEGQHEVRIAVVDAAGQRTVSAPVTFTVRNAPTNTRPPQISGLAKVGAQLTATSGEWAGAPTAFVYQWFRCPAAVTSAADTSGCAVIAGATGQSYAPTEDDVSQRTLVQVTATNAKGSASDISDPSDIVADAGRPVLTNVSLSRKRLLIGKAPAASKTLLRFSSTEGGSLTIVIDRMRRGRAKRVVTLAAKVKAGRSAVLLSTAIGRKRLAPGRYRVTIQVRDEERNISEPVRLPLTVVAG